MLVAKIDLTDEKQRAINDLILRCHSGNRALWRCLKMRQQGDLIVEAVQWWPNRRGSERRYGLISWNIVTMQLRWTQPGMSRDLVIQAVQALDSTTTDPLICIPTKQPSTVGKTQ